MNNPVKMVIGGEEISVPPLSLGRLEKVADELKPLAEAVTLPAKGRAVARVLASALSDDYPNMTAEEVGRVMWASEIIPLYLAVTELFRESGLISAGEALPEETPSAETASARS